MSIVATLIVCLFFFSCCKPVAILCSPSLSLFLVSSSLHWSHLLVKWSHISHLRILMSWMTKGGSTVCRWMFYTWSETWTKRDKRLQSWLSQVKWSFAPLPDCLTQLPFLSLQDSDHSDNMSWTRHGKWWRHWKFLVLFWSRLKYRSFMKRLMRSRLVFGKLTILRFVFLVTHVSIVLTPHWEQLVVHCGVSHLAEGLVLESVANTAGYSSCDVSGCLPSVCGEESTKTECRRLRTDLDLERVALETRQLTSKNHIKVPVSVSKDAGRWVTFLSFTSTVSILTRTDC